MIIEGQRGPQERKDRLMDKRFVAFDVAEDYGSPARALGAVIVLDSNEERATLMSLAYDAMAGLPGAAKDLLAKTEVFIAYSRDGVTWCCWDTENVVSRPVGGTKLNRKFTRTKCKSYPKDDKEYRMTYLRNLVKFLKTARDYWDLEPEERAVVDAGVEYVQDFIANVTTDLVKAEQERFHEMSKSA